MASQSCRAIQRLGAAGGGPTRSGLLALLAVGLGVGLELRRIEVRRGLVVTPFTQQAPAEQLAQLGRYRARGVAALLCLYRHRLRHVGIDIALEFVKAQHPLGHGCSVGPVDVLAAVQQVERLHIVAAIQCQDGALAVHPAAGAYGFVSPVRGFPRAPLFILGNPLAALA